MSLNLLIITCNKILTDNKLSFIFNLILNNLNKISKKVSSLIKKIMINIKNRIITKNRKLLIRSNIYNNFLMLIIATNIIPRNLISLNKISPRILGVENKLKALIHLKFKKKLKKRIILNNNNNMNKKRMNRNTRIMYWMKINKFIIDTMNNTKNMFNRINIISKIIDAMNINLNINKIRDIRNINKIIISMITSMTTSMIIDIKTISKRIGMSISKIIDTKNISKIIGTLNISRILDRIVDKMKIIDNSNIKILNTPTNYSNNHTKTCKTVIQKATQTSK